ncbi:hypothetical protein AHF37_09570 [Paragonimus kellicotti]|nr:hypothetical protein AHF37_09570 [Paragonimus kellicotti]
MIPLGIFTAVNIRVGQKLGAFDPDARTPRRTFYLRDCLESRTRPINSIPQSIGNLYFLVLAVVALCTGLPIILLRNKLPYIFTEDIDVCSLASRLLPMLLVCQLCEGFAVSSVWSDTPQFVIIIRFFVKE